MSSFQFEAVFKIAVYKNRFCWFPTILDTLLPNFLVSKLKSIPLVYDSHEYFTEVPELQGRFARKVWLAIEKWIFPKLKNVFTVNESIAKEYSKKYGVHIEIVRNLPLRQVSFAEINPADFGLTANQKYVILQGSGINLDRGGEEAIMAMHILKTVKLLIVGSGDKLPEMKELVRKHGLEDSVIFIPRQSPDVLRSLTKMAEIGLSLDKDTNPNYRYSLPNKLFDYIQCGIPVLVSDLLEVRKIVETWQVGRVMIDYSIENIASMLRMMLLNNDKQLLKENLKRAAENLTWEQNIPALNRIYNQFLADA